jgi:hypothetical protein
MGAGSRRPRFVDLALVQHWYERPGVELNLANSPGETVIREEDFVFRPVGVDGLYDVPTITAVFTARRPVAAEASLARRVWRALRQRLA